MNPEKLCQILEDSTAIFRKGELVETRSLGCAEVTEIFGYRHTNEAPKEDNFDKVDMVFVDVVVDKTKARYHESELKKILSDYPEPARLAGGPSYIELAPNFGVEQDSALRLMALGKTLGLWKIVSGKTFGADDNRALELAGAGFLMISGYKEAGK
jgi:hypothetical protein